MPPKKLTFRKSSHFSPDSVNVLHSTSSVVSSSSASASASANRSSFASDFHDRDSTASDPSQHLAGHGSGGESLSGVDPHPDKDFTVHKPCDLTDTTHGEDKAFQKQDSPSGAEEDSMPVSFSLALKDCQDKRPKGNGQRKKWNPRHNISLEIKSSSPRLDTLRNTSHLSRPSSAIYSPGTPSYKRSGVSMQKGWNSERVPLAHKGNRVALGPALLPLNNVKALPSKWEDAERWIFSPASGDSSHRQQVHQKLHRKPKAKSGPLGPPGSAYNQSMYALVPMSERKSSADLMTDSPFSARVMKTNDFGKGSPARLEPWMPRSISLHGCSVERQDEKVDSINDMAANISCPVSRRDMATNISPSSSANSSFIRMSYEGNEEQSLSSYLEIIDVEVDKRVTIGSLKSVHRSNANQSNISSRRVDDSTKKAMEPQSSARLVRSQSDESRITAWENLQKAKAEAAIQKLEMKLEKKKASAMEKIMKKLKSAQKKAQEMRNSTLASQLDHASKPSGDKSSSMHKARKKSSMSGCFTCHAFDRP